MTIEQRSHRRWCGITEIGVCTCNADVSVEKALRIMHNLGYRNHAAELEAELRSLRAVANAACALVRSAGSTKAFGGALPFSEEAVSEPLLTELESALAAAGMDMTDEELAATEPAP